MARAPVVCTRTDSTGRPGRDGSRAGSTGATKPSPRTRSVLPVVATCPGSLPRPAPPTPGRAAPRLEPNPQPLKRRTPRRARTAPLREARTVEAPATQRFHQRPHRRPRLLGAHRPRGTIELRPRGGLGLRSELGQRAGHTLPLGLGEPAIKLPHRRIERARDGSVFAALPREVLGHPTPGLGLPERLRERLGQRRRRAAPTQQPRLLRERRPERRRPCCPRRLRRPFQGLRRGLLRRRLAPVGDASYRRVDRRKIALRQRVAHRGEGRVVQSRQGRVDGPLMLRRARPREGVFERAVERVGGSEGLVTGHARFQGAREGLGAYGDGRERDLPGGIVQGCRTQRLRGRAGHLRRRRVGPRHRPRRGPSARGRHGHDHRAPESQHRHDHRRHPLPRQGCHGLPHPAPREGPPRVVLHPRRHRRIGRRLRHERQLCGRQHRRVGPEARVHLGERGQRTRPHATPRRRQGPHEAHPRQRHHPTRHRGRPAREAERSRRTHHGHGKRPPRGA